MGSSDSLENDRNFLKRSFSKHPTLTTLALFFVVLILALLVYLKFSGNASDSGRTPPGDNNSNKNENNVDIKIGTKGADTAVKVGRLNPPAKPPQGPAAKTGGTGSNGAKTNQPHLSPRPSDAAESESADKMASGKKNGKRLLGSPFLQGKVRKTIINTGTADGNGQGAQGKKRDIGASRGRSAHAPPLETNGKSGNNPDSALVRQHLDDSVKKVVAAKRRQDSIAQQNALRGKINFKAPRMPGIDTMSLFRSEYPDDHDEPEITPYAVKSVKEYEPNYAGFWLWTDCKDCSWEISFLGRTSQNIIISDKRPKIMPVNTLYYKLPSDKVFYFDIRDRRDVRYDNYGKRFSYTLNPRETLVLKISKKPRPNSKTRL